MTIRKIYQMMRNGARNKRYGSIAKFWQQRLIAALPHERKQLVQTMEKEVVRRIPLPMCGTTNEDTELLIFADGSGLMEGRLSEQGDFHLIAVHQVISLDQC
jgi:hypothetical protein